MNPKIIYPIPDRQNTFYRNFRKIAGIVFLSASFLCLIINYLLKGKAWSIIVVWSLYSIWRLVFSLRLAEFSIFSHANRVSFYLVVLLLLIDYFLAHGWARIVVPIVLFGDLLIMFVIFFATYERRRRHLVSIIFLGLLNLLFIPYTFSSKVSFNWLVFSFQVASAVLFLVMVIVNFKDLLYEIRVRFKTDTK